MLSKARDVFSCSEHFVGCGVIFEIGCDLVKIEIDIFGAMETEWLLEKGGKNFFAEIISNIVKVVIMKIEGSSSDVSTATEFGDTDIINTVFFLDQFSKGLADEAFSFNRRMITSMIIRH